MSKERNKSKTSVVRVDVDSILPKKVFNAYFLCINKMFYIMHTCLEASITIKPINDIL